jgi:hypothetical protein
MMIMQMQMKKQKNPVKMMEMLRRAPMMKLIHLKKRSRVQRRKSLVLLLLLAWLVL